MTFTRRSDKHVRKLLLELLLDDEDYDDVVVENRRLKKILQNLVERGDIKAENKPRDKSDWVYMNEIVGNIKEVLKKLLVILSEEADREKAKILIGLAEQLSAQNGYMNQIVGNIEEVLKKLLVILLEKADGEKGKILIGLAEQLSAQNGYMNQIVG